MTTMPLHIIVWCILIGRHYGDQIYHMMMIVEICRKKIDQKDDYCDDSKLS